MALQIYQLAFSRVSNSLVNLRQYYPSTTTKCSSSTQVSVNNSRLEMYQPTIWTHDFIEVLDDKFPINKKKKAKELEKNVMALITGYENGNLSALQVLEHIDDVERLGLGYRFQNEIQKALNIIISVDGRNVGLEDNLHATSLRFRLLRQHGYNVSQDFLKRFKNIHGDFMECLQSDVKGLLSLYEASYLAFEEEKDLHEAKLFATKHLLKHASQKNEVLDNIDRALKLPLYRRMLRLQARWNINAYNMQKDANIPLLEFAALDFNMVQSTHKRELQELSRWWRKTGVAGKLSFVRDRIMECFFWTVGMVFEPQYDSCRVGLTKVASLITVIDDIYDVYGTLEELEIFTYAVKRWDINAMKDMPEYLQVAFGALYDTINELGSKSLIDQGEDAVPILVKAWGELLETFLVEAKWTHQKYIPTLEEYMDNAWRSVSGVVLLTHGYFLINSETKKDVTKPLEYYYDLMKWSSTIFRLWNDLGTSSDEIARGKTANAVSCYMHENAISEDVAREYIETRIDEAWINKFTFTKTKFSPQWRFLIHTLLTCLSSKKTGFHELPSYLANALVCLATGTRFNFSKLILDGMVRNLDPKVNKFIMYPRFVQVFINDFIPNLPELKQIFIVPPHKHKIFANMRREAKDFSGRITPLFRTMVAASPATEVVPPTTSGPAVQEQVVPPTTSQPKTVGGTTSKQGTLTLKTYTRSKKATRAKKRVIEAVAAQSPQSNEPVVQQQMGYEELDVQSVRAAPTVSSPLVEQDRGNINKTQAEATLEDEPINLGDSSGPSTKNQGTSSDHARHEDDAFFSYDSPMESHPKGDEDSYDKELMEAEIAQLRWEFMEKNEEIKNLHNDMKVMADWVMVKDAKIDQLEKDLDTQADVILVQNKKISKLTKLVKSVLKPRKHIKKKMLKSPVQPKFYNSSLSDDEEEEHMLVRSVKPQHQQKVISEDDEDLEEVRIESEQVIEPVMAKEDIRLEVLAEVVEKVITSPELVEKVSEPVKVAAKAMTEPVVVRPPGYKLKIAEPTDVPIPKPKIDLKDKGKTKVVVPSKQKKRKQLLIDDADLAKIMQAEEVERVRKEEEDERIRMDEELARKFQAEEEMAAKIGDRVHEVSIKGKKVKMTKDEVAKFDEMLLKKREEMLKLKQLQKDRAAEQKKRAEEIAKKKQTKPRTKAQLRNDMMRQLKGLIPGLVKMSYDEVKGHYDRYKAKHAPQWKALDEDRRNKVESSGQKKIEKEKGQDVPLKDWYKNIDEFVNRPDPSPVKETVVDESGPSKEVTTTVEAIHAQPIVMAHPVIRWSIVQKVHPVKREEIKLERRGGKVQYYVSFWHMCNNISFLDLNELYILCLKMDKSKLKSGSEELMYEYITMVYEPNSYPHLFRGSKLIKAWSFIRSCGLYHIICHTNERIFMAHTKFYDLSLSLWRDLIRVKPSGVECDETKKLVQTAKAQIKRINEEHEKKSKEAAKKYGKD